MQVGGKRIEETDGRDVLWSDFLLPFPSAIDNVRTSTELRKKHKKIFRHPLPSITPYPTDSA